LGVGEVTRITAANRCFKKCAMEIDNQKGKLTAGDQIEDCGSV